MNTYYEASLLNFTIRNLSDLLKYLEEYLFDLITHTKRKRKKKGTYWIWGHRLSLNHPSIAQKLTLHYKINSLICFCSPRKGLEENNQSHAHTSNRQSSSHA